MDIFTLAYIECALWSSCDDDYNSLDENYSSEDISKECLKQIEEDCQKFQSENFEMISDNLSQAGHDFWLTRNGHGAGFWDGDWSEHDGLLTAKCDEFGPCELYVGDDDKIYC